MNRYWLAVLLVCVLALAGVVTEAQRHVLEYAPSPADNPLKGLVPYSGDVRGVFPHSLEFFYLPLSAVLVSREKYDWQPLEKRLNEIAGRGHQAIFRIYLEYPGKTGAIPPFLLKGGLKVHKYRNTNTQPLPPTQVETPDYADKNLRTALARFIGALGRKYDGDPRLGFITAGLLGTWGEWHTYPREELFASKAVQTEIMDAYQAAFKTTPILLRYPAGDNDDRKAANVSRPFGYHDDSFAWATLETGKRGDEWFYLSLLKSAGPGALTKWKTAPIGGEIRPEAWGKVFDPPPVAAPIQDFSQCVSATHVTWLMDSGMFEKKQSEGRIARARQQVVRMGYEFYAATVMVNSQERNRLSVAVDVENRGVAPFYYRWPIEYGLLMEGKVVKRFPARGQLTGILPGAKPTVWREALDVTAIPAGSYKLALRVPNPLPGGHPVRFANKTQDADAPGWLTLCPIQLP